MLNYPKFIETPDVTFKRSFKCNTPLMARGGYLCTGPSERAFRICARNLFYILQESQHVHQQAISRTERIILILQKLHQ